MTTRKMKTDSFTVLTVVLLLAITVTVGYSQHRGDNLSFQGLSSPNQIGVKGIAMGGAYTSMTGDLNSLYWNAAGLADINRFQLSLSVNSYNINWRENQEYRPDRFFVTLPFYLEGLYIPDPNNNGKWDYDIADSSTYNVQYPQLGVEPFSEKAADWKRKQDNFGLNNVSAALPLSFSGQKFVVSAAYNRQYNINNFDRNDTYLNPFLGYSEYNMPGRVDGTDTVRVDWYRFLRQRQGDLASYSGAVAYNLSEKIKVGAGMNIVSGETDDLQMLNKVGYFDLYKENRFMYSYDTLDTQVKGTSDFSSTNFNIGLVLKFENFNFGFNLVTPYTISRKWDYTTTRIDTNGAVSSKSSGTDKLELPATFTVGVSFRPIQQFVFSFDYDYAPYSKAKLKLAQPDSTSHQWVDRKTLRFGIELKPVRNLSFLAGYKSIPAVFIPDGAAFKDRGPTADSYTFGLSLKLNSLGQIDTAYEIYRFKYYDQYYSNTNYAFESKSSLYVAYTYSF